jgi:hypothetical protein
MTRQDEPSTPLASGWEYLRAQLAKNRKRTEVEIAMFRFAFYVGARFAIRTAAHNTMTLPLMAIEVREFERTLKDFLAEAAASAKPVNVQ